MKKWKYEIMAGTLLLLVSIGFMKSKLELWWDLCV